MTASEFSQGNKLLRSNQLEEAVAAYQKAIALHPNFHWSHYKLGEALEQLGRLEEAIAAYRKAIAIKANSDYKYYEQIGKALEQKGELEEAISNYKKAIIDQGDEIDSFDVVYRLNTNFEEKSELKNAIERCNSERKKLAIYQKMLFKKISSETFTYDDRLELKSIFYSVFPQSEMDISMTPDATDVRIGAGDSYVSSIVSLIKIKGHMKSLGINILPGGNDKRKDAEFAKLFGIPVPEVYQNDVPFTEVRLKSGTVIKPRFGCSSCGVFTVNDNLMLRSLRTKKRYDTLEAAYKEVVRVKNKISINRWMSEEWVTINGKSANDLKVYAFYGECALFLEIDRAGDKNKYCWYDSDLKKINFPVSAKNLDFDGTGVPCELVKYAEQLSKEYPCPFARIDFLKGDTGLYLGEVTPHPGRYYGGMPTDVDKKLGGFFNRAWARLLIDLIGGKSFNNYFEIYQ